MVTLELKTRNKYSKIIIIPPFLRKMLNWEENLVDLNFEIKGSTITLTPAPTQQTHIKQPKPHESKEQQEEKMLKDMVKNDTKKTVKLEKKKRA